MRSPAEHAEKIVKQVERDGGLKMGCGCFFPVQRGTFKTMLETEGYSAIDELEVSAVINGPHTCSLKKRNNG